MAKKTKTIFVTGASGYIAKHIVLQLLQKGYHVRGSVRSDKKADEVRAAMTAHLQDSADLDKRLTFSHLNLLSDEGWDDALMGIDALFHTASPFPLESPKDEDDLIRPAVDGTLRALKGAVSAGVKRVVLTSSFAAIGGKDLEPPRTVYDESDWSELDHPKTPPYSKSKTMAEMAAWDFVKKNPGIKLTVINPTFVLGPGLDKNVGSSLQVIQRILQKKDPAVPQLSFPIVDVRDIARMHVAAFETPKSVGKRFVGASKTMWFLDIANTLNARFPDRKLVTRLAPKWLIKLLAMFDGALKAVVPLLGQNVLVDNSAAQKVLGIDFIPAETAVGDAAAFLIENDIVT